MCLRFTYFADTVSIYKFHSTYLLTHLLTYLLLAFMVLWQGTSRPVKSGRRRTGKTSSWRYEAAVKLTAIYLHMYLCTMCTCVISVFIWYPYDSFVIGTMHYTAVVVACKMTLWPACLMPNTDHTHTLVQDLPAVHLSYNDCLEDKREHCQNFSMPYCVAQLCTIICTLLWAILTDELFYVQVLSSCFAFLIGSIYLSYG